MVDVVHYLGVPTLPDDVYHLGHQVLLRLEFLLKQHNLLFQAFVALFVADLLDVGGGSWLGLGLVWRDEGLEKAVQ